MLIQKRSATGSESTSSTSMLPPASSNSLATSSGKKPKAGKPGEPVPSRQSRPFRCRHQSYARKRVTLGIPVVTLDVDGVGELIRLAVDRGSAARPGLKLGICGEHGGDLMSIGFCSDALRDAWTGRPE